MGTPLQKAVTQRGIPSESLSCLPLAVILDGFNVQRLKKQSRQHTWTISEPTTVQKAESTNANAGPSGKDQVHMAT